MRRSSPKIGRNDPCPCGSGKKYKRCHGSVSSPSALPFEYPNFLKAMEQKREEFEATELRRRKQQGLGRPIVSGMHSGYRLVAVGSTIHWSKSWLTFHDFLRDYFLTLIGREWLAAQRKLPEPDRHPIALWVDRAFEDAKRLGQKSGSNIYNAPMTGAIRAFLNLAYNLYLIGHHADQRKEELLDLMVSRLKNERDFAGSLFETYVAAAFLRAGFDLDYEDEADAEETHGEFVALYPETGKRFWVEAKARDRSAANASGEGQPDEVKRLGIGNKLYKALRKDAKYARAVFIDVGIPDAVKRDEFGGWMRSAVDQIREKEPTLTIDGKAAPSAYVFITNHAYHLNLEKMDTGYAVVADGFKIDDFGPDVAFPGFKEMLDARDRHKEMFALMQSLTTHYEIPSTFEGEIPELVFGDPSHPRLRIGHKYLVPDEDGNEVAGKLVNAIMIPEQKRVMGIYELSNGRKIIADCPVTEDEIAAYKKYPDTFFDARLEVGHKAKDVVDLFDFFFETYQHSSKEKLLSFMAEASNFEELKKLSQRDLAIKYCEGVALSAAQRSEESQ